MGIRVVFVMRFVKPRPTSMDAEARTLPDYGRVPPCGACRGKCVG